MLTSHDVAESFKKNRSFSALEKEFGGKVAESGLWNTSRWSVFYRYIFRVNDQYFEIIDEQPATELQDNDECITQVTEVEPQEKVIIEYSVKSGAETVEVDRY